MPIMDDQEPAFFERPFRTQATNTLRGCGRERHFSSMLWRQKRLGRLPSSILHVRSGSKRTSRAFRGSGADSSGTCRAFCGPRARSSRYFEPAVALSQARAAISRASCGSGPGSSGHFASQLRRQAKLERPFRASCSSGPGSTDHFERLDVANVGRCGVFEADTSRNQRSTARAQKRETYRTLRMDCFCEHLYWVLVIRAQFPFPAFGKILLLYSRFSRTYKTDLKDLSAHVFSPKMFV